MDGGHDQNQASPAQQPEADVDPVETRVAADVAALAEVPYLVHVLAGLDAAIEEALAVRCAALGPQQLAAFLRRLHGLRSRLDAVTLVAVEAVDDRDDVVPAARPGTAAAVFLQHSLGFDRRSPAREAEAARLIDPDTGDLQAVGAAYSAGQMPRARRVRRRVRRRLSAGVRESVPVRLRPRPGPGPDHRDRDRRRAPARDRGRPARHRAPDPRPAQPRRPPDGRPHRRPPHRPAQRRHRRRHRGGEPWTDRTAGRRRRAHRPTTAAAAATGASGRRSTPGRRHRPGRRRRRGRPAAAGG